MKNRVLSFVCVLSILVSLCVVPVSANEWYADPGSVDEWDAKFNNVTSLVSITLLEAWAAFKGLDVDADAVEIMWSIFNTAIGDGYGSVTQGELETICVTYNSFFNRPIEPGLFAFDDYMSNLSNKVIAGMMGLSGIHFEIQEHPISGLYRIKETTTGIWVVNSSGLYPYTEISSGGETEAGDQWIGEVTAQDRSQSGAVALHTLDRINLICNRLKNEGIPVQLKTLNDVSGKQKYRGIWYNRQFYADPSGNPYVAPYDPGEWAVNQDRDDTTVTDEDGNEVEGLPEDNSSGIDLENMLIYLPNGSIGMIDHLQYDETNNTYSVDSHDIYNTYITYNYTYYINYTSITYIGTTEEYEKYEVYYELPDGRSSADLTKEDLEQLNLAVDVIPYGRSTDNTTVRSLYHFDGDTKDASYWNYCTDFVWNDGASLTYMDVGVFEGALYLDENEHDFDFVMPSGMGSGDLTLQWRMYPSHTLAPQTDSYIQFGDVQVAYFDGLNLYNGEKVALDTYSTGIWNEFALIRQNGIIYYYINGLCVGSWENTTPFQVIKFYFGDDQQTFKYFDELRVLNYALAEDGVSYEPTSTPHGSNLALVLPDQSKPIADEYIEFTHTKDYYAFLDFSTGTMPDNLKYSSTTPARGTWGYSKAETYMTYSDRFVTIGEGVLRHHMFTLDEGDYTLSFGDGDAVFTILFADGTSDTVVFDGNSVLDEVTFDWGSVKSGRSGTSPTWTHRLMITFTSPVDVVGIEVAPGTESNFTAKLISSVVIMTPDQIKTPTLAVKTDIEFGDKYQLGGVRPSVPEKGQVWAMIENQRIVSLQVYNGQAWEAVEGRIWTGERWIPPSSYNIITLQDMYDIVDATPDFEYIYSESGFWAWWQKSWNAFTERLFIALGSGGAGAGGGAGADGLNGVDLDAEDPVLIPEEEDGKTFWEFILLLIVGGKSVVSGVREITSGAVSSVPESMDDIVSAFDSGGLAVGVLDGSSMDPDAADLPQDDSGDAVLAEVEEVDPWRYR